MEEEEKGMSEGWEGKEGGENDSRNEGKMKE